MKGKIIKAISGFYYVHDGNNIYACRARGLFRNRDMKPLVGDNVEFEITHDKDMEGLVTDIFDRKNELTRPAVSNVDMMLAFFAFKNPVPNVLHISRLLLEAETAGITPVLVFNKGDLAGASKKQKIIDAFVGTDYDIHIISVRSGEGIDEIRPLLKGKTTVLAGPSGVGKSSFLNAVMGDDHMQTGDISEKLHRGKHTTRHTELFYLGDESFLLDTPGFSALDNDLEPEQIQEYFPEISRHIGKCRFNVCSHINEPDCAVKNALQNGEISQDRYEAYTVLYEERKAFRKYYRRILWLRSHLRFSLQILQILRVRSI